MTRITKEASIIASYLLLINAIVIAYSDRQPEVTISIELCAFFVLAMLSSFSNPMLSLALDAHSIWHRVRFPFRVSLLLILLVLCLWQYYLRVIVTALITYSGVVSEIERQKSRNRRIEIIKITEKNAFNATRQAEPPVVASKMLPLPAPAPAPIARPAAVESRVTIDPSRPPISEFFGLHRRRHLPPLKVSKNSHTHIEQPNHTVSAPIITIESEKPPSSSNLVVFEPNKQEERNERESLPDIFQKREEVDDISSSTPYKSSLTLLTMEPHEEEEEEEERENLPPKSKKRGLDSQNTDLDLQVVKKGPRLPDGYRNREIVLPSIPPLEGVAGGRHRGRPLLKRPLSSSSSAPQGEDEKIAQLIFEQAVKRKRLSKVEEKAPPITSSTAPLSAAPCAALSFSAPSAAPSTAPSAASAALPSLSSAPSSSLPAFSLPTTSFSLSQEKTEEPPTAAPPSSSLSSLPSLPSSEVPKPFNFSSSTQNPPFAFPSVPPPSTSTSKEGEKKEEKGEAAPSSAPPLSLPPTGLVGGRPPPSPTLGGLGGGKEVTFGIAFTPKDVPEGAPFQFTAGTGGAGIAGAAASVPPFQFGAPAQGGFAFGSTAPPAPAAVPSSAPFTFSSLPTPSFSGAAPLGSMGGGFPFASSASAGGGDFTLGKGSSSGTGRRKPKPKK